MDRENRLHMQDLMNMPASGMADRDGVYFFIADEISDTGFIMKTTQTLMNKGCRNFYFLGKHKGIWHKTVEDMFRRSGMDCKNFKSCDSMDDAAEKASKFLDSGRDVWLLYDSKKLCATAADKIRQQEMHVNFHIGSLINSME